MYHLQLCPILVKPREYVQIVLRFLVSLECGENPQGTHSNKMFYCHWMCYKHIAFRVSKSTIFKKKGQFFYSIGIKLVYGLKLCSILRSQLEWNTPKSSFWVCFVWC